MARVPFLLRVDAKVLDALRRWADDELRSVNGQLDYVLRQALRNAGRLKPGDIETTDKNAGDPDEPRG